ncbi:MAG: O-antigen ligase family protein [Chthoniobacterales bacterium]|nr:O-antigen ligase family protein [Chthoniobacterales bacterium]
MELAQRIGRSARHLAGWLLVVALFYSPWDEGGTSVSAIRHLNWILGSVFGLWMVGTLSLNVGRRREGESYEGRQFRSWTLLGLTAVLLLLGWGMALNARAIFDDDYAFFLPLSAPVAAAPGAVDYFLSVALMWRVTALVGCIWVMASLSQDERWVLRIWWAIGLAGGSIALLGLVQKATGAQMPFWQTPEEGEGAVTTFFASYYYHGNAGAYLNLALPAVLGLAYRYVTRSANPLARALWLTLSVIIMVAVASDTSRMGQFLAGLMVLVLLAIFARKSFRSLRHLEMKTALLALVVGGLTTWAVVRTSHLDRSLGRWERFRSSWTQDARWVVDRIALEALPQAGALGFGPGTFSVVFPTFLHDVDPRDQASWLFLHDDYLQTLLEWGWIGGALWGAVFFGGIGVAVRSLMNKQQLALWYSRQQLFLPLAVVALAGVALHAAVDFPLQISSIQLYVATYLGICWGSGRWGKGKAEKLKVER